MSRSSHFAVIDTETNWHDEVMSIGIVIADSVNFKPIGAKYYLLDPEVKSEILRKAERIRKTYIRDDRFKK